MAQKDADELKMTRWKWAYLLDTCTEERVKGKTHQYSTRNFTYKGLEYQLIDTPGHQMFVRSTVEAIGNNIDATALVITSAIENEFSSAFDKGMLKEQCVLARASGIQHIVVAVNKMDAVNWDNNTYEQIRSRLESFLAKLKFGSIQYFPISAYEGKNVLQILDMLPDSSDTLASKQDTGEVRKRNLACKIKILKCENVITAGYRCIAHINGEELVCTVSHVSGSPFLRAGDAGKVRLSFDEEVRIPKTARIVLRNNESTIGFACPVENS